MTRIIFAFEEFSSRISSYFFIQRAQVDYFHIILLHISSNELTLHNIYIYFYSNINMLKNEYIKALHKIMLSVIN